MSPRLAAVIWLASSGAAGFVTSLVLGSFATLATPAALAALWCLAFAGFLSRPEMPHVLLGSGFVGGVALLAWAAAQLVEASFAGYLALAALAVLHLAAYEIAGEPSRVSTALLPALVLLGIRLGQPELSSTVAVSVAVLGAAFVMLSREAVRTFPASVPLFASVAWALGVLALFAMVGATGPQTP